MDQWNVFKFFEKSFMRPASQEGDVDYHNGFAVRPAAGAVHLDSTTARPPLPAHRSAVK